MKKLSRDFYNRDTITVAQELLGKYLVHKVDGEELAGKIVEVEAYKGPLDKAAHSYNNRRTSRNEVMYGEAGYAYVFIIYGMYDCMNVVTTEKERPEAVLIRALEPVKGIDKMAANRFGKELTELNKREYKNLTNGPGKLGKAMKITRALNGEDLLGDRLYITEGHVEKLEIVTSKRIGIDYAEEAIDFPWRFYIKDNKFVSKI